MPPVPPMPAPQPEHISSPAAMLSLMVAATARIRNFLRGRPNQRRIDAGLTRRVACQQGSVAELIDQSRNAAGPSMDLAKR